MQTSEAFRKATVASVTINTLCNIIGGAILALPAAMHEGSVVVSLIALFICLVASAFSVDMIVRSCDATGKYSYAECFASAVACGSGIRRRVATVSMDAILFLNTYLLLIVYARVIADSMPPVMVSVDGPTVLKRKEFWQTFPSIIFFGLTCVRNMKELVWSSVVGVVTILYVIVAIYFRGLVGVQVPISDIPHTREISWITMSPVRVLSVMSTFATAMQYHFNVPYLYAELKDRRPAVMMETVRRSFAVVALCYASTALFGYLTFGALVASPQSGGNIVNNYPFNDTVMNVGRLGLFFHFAAVYPVMAVCARRSLHKFVCAAMQRDDIATPDATPRLYIIFEAFAIVGTNLFFAAVVPGIDIVVQLIGALFGIPIIFFFPSVMAMSTTPSVLMRWPAPFTNVPAVRTSRAAWMLLASGGVFFVFGLFDTMKSIFS